MKRQIVYRCDFCGAEYILNEGEDPSMLRWKQAGIEQVDYACPKCYKDFTDLREMKKVGT